MKDCWLNPFGEIVWCRGAWSHNQDAERILIERYGFEDEIDIYSRYPFKNATDVLMDEYRWCRYSTCANRGWCWNKELTTDQKNKMFDLTGFVE